jgi:tripeptide aminopeptidase
MRDSTPLSARMGAVHRTLAPLRARLVQGDATTLRTQVDVTEIAAPTGAEGARAEWVAARFRSLGLSDVRVDEAGNVIGRRLGTGRDSAPVVVCAHLDTVFPAGTDLRVRTQGDTLAAPGIGDNGRGLAGMLALAGVLQPGLVQTERPIELVATTGEEGSGDLRGAKHYFAHSANAAAMIALDGAGDERIVNRALGARRFRISYNGPGGHSWGAYGVPNAVHAAGIAVAKLALISLPTEPRTTLTVGRIGGGLSVNSIPGHAWLEIDIRSTSEAALTRVSKEVTLIMRAAADVENDRRAHGSPPLSCGLEVIGERPCGELPEDHSLVQMAIHATRLVNREPELATASTDSNVPISLGIPAVTIGAGGRGGEAHTQSEWFRNLDGPLGLGRALTLVVGAAGLVQAR